MKHYAYYLPSGEISVSCSLQDESDPSGLNGRLHIETPERVSGDTHWVNAGVLAAYTTEGLARKQQKPAYRSSWNPAAERWDDVRDLAQRKTDQWAAIKKSREAAEFGGFTWDGSSFDSDAMSQSRIMGAVQLAQLDPNFTIAWTLADNSVRQLSATDMVAVGVALGDHVATQHAKARALRAQIEAAQTAAEAEAVVW